MKKVYGNFLLPFSDSTEGVFRKRGDSEVAAVIIDNRGDDDFWFPRVVHNFEMFNPEWNYYHLKPFGRFGPVEFSKVLKDARFWEMFQEPKIVIFQSDCICCQALDPKYLQYDYIGAPCATMDETFIMNGGLSLRSREWMLKAIRADLVVNSVEDVFFTKSLRLLNANLPSFEEAVNFSVESLYNGTLPFGVHGTDKNYHTSEVAEAIVKGVLNNDD